MKNPVMADSDQIIFRSNNILNDSFELFLAMNEIPPIPNKALATIRDMSGSTLPQPSIVKKYSGKKNSGIAIKKSTIQ